MTRVDIDEAIRQAGNWLDLEIMVAALNGLEPPSLAACERAAADFHRLRAAKARGETHVDVEE